MERRSQTLLAQGLPEALARGKRKHEATEPPHRLTLPPTLKHKGTVLIIDDDSSAASEVADLLAAQGHSVELEPRLDDALLAIARTRPDVVVADPFGAHGPGDAFVDAIKRRTDGLKNTPEIVLVTRRASVESAVGALHAGAADYVVKPAPPSRVLQAIQRAVERRRLLNENARLKHDLALFAAAQRILEVLDPDALLTFALQTLFTFGGAEKGALLAMRGPSERAIADSRGLTPAECASIEAAHRKAAFVPGRHKAADFDATLAHLQDALVAELGPSQSAVLFAANFSLLHEESVQFLALELATAFKNSARYADAEMSARRDSLTGLWNARTFEQSLTHLVTTCEQNKLPCSLVFIDVDRFKSVNDTYGHVAGSKLLVELAQLLLKLLREGDVVARFGGDEFTVLLPEVDAERAARVCERIRATIERHMFESPNGSPIHVTVSLGVASYPQHAESPTDLFEAADRAMYCGKGQSRNVVFVATPMRESR